ELALAILGGDFERRLRDEIMLLPEERLADPPDDAVVVRLARLDELRVDLAVARRHTVIGGALEHGELLCLLRNLGNGLHRGGTGADHRDTLPGKVDAGL